MKLKWTIHELIKKAKTDNLITKKLNLRHFLNEKLDDVSDIYDTEISGEYHHYPNDNLFVFDLRIKTGLTMLCSVSLEKVEITLDFKTLINFSQQYVNDDTHIIEGITLDLAPYIFSEILVEKPMKVISKNAKVEKIAEFVTMTEEEKQENNPFPKLKK